MHRFSRPFKAHSRIMFVLEEPKSSKRPRRSPEPEDPEQEPISKRQKSESRAQSGYPPPRFWDTLSKIRLTRGALKEFERRNVHEKCRPHYIAIANIGCAKGRARQRLKRLAHSGGLDLSHLRGVSLPCEREESRLDPDQLCL